ncbi:dipeptide epimerase [Levilinea saccharolytica]|uniref:Dipeptide epimerase n=2 Tax=Levilinea saccharolytica TaxID=229921 RepID=A0A0M8JS18_9CHLR|nr:dipeptide epimerase [Levilinea saccharolytica]GAP19355.1 L-alanine-DL-glutamate epimerase [Levilinea saccharolytica]
MSTPSKLTWEMLTLKLRNPFRLSYGVSEERQAYWIRLQDDSGWGEGTIPPYYRVDASAMTNYWAQTAANPAALPDDPADFAAFVGSAGPAPARCAVDLALYDRLGKRLGQPLYRLLGLPQPQPQPTSFTIAIDTPEAMAQMAQQIASYPIIKIKLGSDDDRARLAAIRAARPDARLRVDANAGWSRAEAQTRLEELLPFDLEMIEQPLAKEDIEGMGQLQATCPIPIVADESVQTLEDVENLARAGVHGINLKLMKIGGLTPALVLLKRAQALGLRIMLGCMIETSIGTTAMAHLAGTAEWLDLDAPMLISNDPFDGVQFDPQATLSVPERAGIGAILKETN